MREHNYYSESGTSAGIIAFVIGGLIGGTLALLYAPQSGKKTREYLITEGPDKAEQVIKSLRETQESILSSVTDALERMETMNRDTKEKLQRLQDLAQDLFSEEKQILEKGYKEAKGLMRD